MLDNVKLDNLRDNLQQKKFLEILVILPTPHVYALWDSYLEEKALHVGYFCLGETQGDFFVFFSVHQSVA